MLERATSVRAAVTEEGAEFTAELARKTAVPVGKVMPSMAVDGADRANSNSVRHATSVTVVPMLCHKFLMSLRIGAEFVLRT